MLGSNMGNYPWLADSWPTPNLTQTSKDSGKLDTDRYYNSKNALTLKVEKKEHLIQLSLFK